jgi:hypothetical protein
MELIQLNCCGVFELCNIGDVAGSDEEDREVWNAETERYDYLSPTAKDRRKDIRTCKLAIRDQLADIAPRGRMVLATTTPDMGVAAAALKSLRFKASRPFRNGNSGNRVTLWTKYVR